MRTLVAHTHTHTPMQQMGADAPGMEAWDSFEDAPSQRDSLLPAATAVALAVAQDSVDRDGSTRRRMVSFLHTNRAHR